MSPDDLKKIKILNIGWVGQGDFGDEAMAYALRRFLKRNGIDSITYYQHGKYPHHRSRDDSRISFLHKFEGRGWKRYLFDNILLKKFNALIIGGGSILHSHENIRWKYDIFKKIKKSNKKIFSANIGVSLGPFKSEREMAICGEFLDEVDISIFRDNWSADLAKKISRNEKLLASLDTLLVLPELYSEEIKQIKNKKREQDMVGVMFVKKQGKEKGFDKNGHFEKYLAIINRLLEKNKKIILFTLYVGNSYLDGELNNFLKQKCRFPEKVQIHTYNGDIFRTAKEMGRCSYVISMRLHGIIFAYMLGIPFLSLGYDPKNQNFCDSINYPKKMSFDFNYLDDAGPVLGSLDFLLEEGLGLFYDSLPSSKATEIVGRNLDFFINEMKKKLL